MSQDIPEPAMSICDRQVTLKMCNRDLRGGGVVEQGFQFGCVSIGFTGYPWSGKVRVEVTPEAAATCDLKLRIPGLPTGASAGRNGQPVAPLAIERGYRAIRQRREKGELVSLDLPMTANRPTHLSALP